jgi:hypothetical protein
MRNAELFRTYVFSNIRFDRIFLAPNTFERQKCVELEGNAHYHRVEPVDIGIAWYCVALFISSYTKTPYGSLYPQEYVAANVG